MFFSQRKAYMIASGVICAMYVLCAITLFFGVKERKGEPISVGVSTALFHLHCNRPHPVYSFINTDGYCRVSHSHTHWFNLRISLAWFRSHILFSGLFSTGLGLLWGSGWHSLRFWGLRMALGRLRFTPVTQMHLKKGSTVIDSAAVC